MPRFDGRTDFDIRDIWRDGEAGAGSVERLVQLPDAKDAEPLVCHDSHARVEGSHTPESCA